MWLIDGARVTWPDVFDERRWDRDKQGHPRPRPRAGATTDVSGLPEYSMHAAGLALLLAAIMAPFRGTGAVEPMALVCAVAVSLAALAAFRQLLGLLGADPVQTNLVSRSRSSGRLWHYARSLYTEPYLTAIVLWAYWLVLGRAAHLPAGCLIATGMLMKPPLGLLLVPLAVRAWARRTGERSPR